MAADAVCDNETSEGPAATAGPSRFAVSALIVLVWFTTGANFVGYAVAVETIPPFLMSATRLFPAGVIIVGLVCLNRRAPGLRALTAVQWRNTFIMATLLMVLSQGAIAWSVQFIDAGVAAIITASMPVWVAVIAVFLFGHRLSTPVWVGVAAGFIGLVILALSEGVEARSALVPLIVALAATLAGAIGGIFGGRADLSEQTVLGSGLQMVFASVVLAVVSLAIGEIGSVDLSEISGRSWFAWLWLLFVGSVVGFPALIWTTRHAPPAAASTFAYVGPIVGLALSVWLLGEELTSLKVVAVALTLAGAALMFRDRGEDAR